jgi:hypothetical protein
VAAGSIRGLNIYQDDERNGRLGAARRSLPRGAIVSPWWTLKQVGRALGASGTQGAPGFLVSESVDRAIPSMLRPLLVGIDDLSGPLDWSVLWGGVLVNKI